MPRGARIDLPGLLQHVIVRGIEKRPIFMDERDRASFRSRLCQLLSETGMQCYAWALLPNHFHLLLRPRWTRLGTFMARLLTGYAVTFNLRHKRSGRLYQNRYKSIVCEDEPYFLELVRYIHLNPLRAGLVEGMEDLAGYPWSGHAVIMGRLPMPQQGVDEVLIRFGRTPEEARVRYEEFVAAGVSQGRRDDLVGGGLRRRWALQGRSNVRESYDERVLGSGAFVEELWSQDDLRDRLHPPVGLAELIERVAAVFGVLPERLASRSRDPAVSQARAVVCYAAVHELGISGSEVGRALGMGQSGVSRAAARGRELWQADQTLRARILKGDVHDLVT